MSNQDSYRDPRPDLDKLGQDSELWVELLQLARKVDSRLDGTLHGFRCQGTVLRKSPRWGYILQPVINNKIGWTSQKDYNEQRVKWLDPYRQDIIKILGDLAQLEKEKNEVLEQATLFG